MKYACVFSTIVLVAAASALAQATTQPASQGADVNAVAALRVAFLTEAMNNPDWRFRDNVARELGEIGPAASASTDALKTALTDKAWQVRRRAVQALIKIDPSGESFREALAPLLNDANVWVKLAAAEVAARTGDAAAGVPVLTKAVEDPNPFIRLEAILALGRVGPAAASATNVISNKPLVDRDPAIRAAATWTLKRIGAKKNP